MSVLHLAFDIDSNVYPELHAMLSAIESSASRGERLRQLAAIGLVWEALRVHGPVVPPQLASARVPPAPPPSRSSRPEFVAEPVAPEPPPPTARPAKGGRSRKPSPADFVDLAIDAPPVQASQNPTFDMERHKATNERGGTASAASASPRKPRDVPVLREVVDFQGAMDLLSNAFTETPAKLPQAAPPMADEPVEVLAQDDMPVVTRAAPRSRVLRMKEKGLFKNE